MTNTAAINKAVKKANRQLFFLCHRGYFEFIPVKEMKDILQENGLDPAELDGIYCGEEGRSTAKVSDKKYLHMTWYRMPSRRYEIVAYIS